MIEILKESHPLWPVFEVINARTASQVTKELVRCTRSLTPGPEMKVAVILTLLGFLVGYSRCTLPALTNIHSKFQYKYSFRGPHLLDSKGNIPFWNHGGSKS